MKKLLINQKGSSMVEMLGVLSIVGIVGLGILKIISSVQNMFTQNMVISEARDLQKYISDRYRFDGNYENLFKDRTCGENGGDDTVAAFICENKLAPFQMCSNGKLHHRGGGDVKICKFSISANETDYSKYNMIFYGLSNTACASLAQVNWYTRQKSDVYLMVINGDSNDNATTIYSQFITGDHGDNIFPVSTAKALSACNNENNNTIQLTFF